MSSFISLFTSAIAFGTIIMFGALGEILTEKGGHLNLGVPGIMYIGAICGLISSFFYERGGGTSPFVGMLLSLIACFVGSAIGGLIYAFLTITLRANQNVTGLSLTIFGGGVANFFGASVSTLSNKTRTGLNLRAVGESPATADAAGINVTKYKYLATCVGAGISGLGGVFYVMEYTLGTWANGKIIEGLGWLAVALVIFASWKPVNAIWGSYLFGFVYWAYLYIPGLGRSTQELFKMLPYVITLVVLIVVSLRKKRENQPPASLGLSYFREER